MTAMTAVAPVRVLIADDHAPTRSDVREALEDSGRFAVCAEAPDAAAAVEAAVRERPEVCVIDVRMPGGGVAAVWEIAARLPETKIVMLTVSADDGDLFAALRAGADGYLLKHTDLAPLPQALEDVLEGRAAIPPALVARLVAEFRDRRPRRRSILARDDGPQLTSREWQVLDLMRQELATAEIARRLVVSQTTVRTHVAAILHKLGAPDRASVVRLFEGQ
jgi:DNA-binding NarL/FixJ family response regulator